MVSLSLRRKTLFRAAVQLEGKTVEQWAAEQPNEKTGELGVSTPHLYEVLNERTTSAPLLARVDAVIQAHFPEFDPAAAAVAS